MAESIAMIFQKRRDETSPRAAGGANAKGPSCGGRPVASAGDARRHNEARPRTAGLGLQAIVTLAGYLFWNGLFRSVRHIAPGVEAAHGVTDYEAAIEIRAHRTFARRQRFGLPGAARTSVERRA